MSATIRDVAAGILLTVLVGGVVWWQQQQYVPPGPAPSGADNAIPMDEVAAHDSRDDCWSAINGNVYDLTAWISAHPGGEAAIVQLCGTDGSEPFNRMHGGSPQPAAALDGFTIGVLDTQ